MTLTTQSTGGVNRRGEGTSNEIERKRRYIRDYQAKRRGSRSYKSELERLKIVLAWERGEVSTGCAAKALGLDIVDTRGLANDAVAEGVQLCQDILGMPGI